MQERRQNCSMYLLTWPWLVWLTYLDAVSAFEYLEYLQTWAVRLGDTAYEKELNDVAEEMARIKSTERQMWFQ
ncbi:MAG: hypothetical protein IH908_01185 [Proteobacteria bacterium]|nr:hypothetical protein [Pseudomonadota bacterium]